MTTPLVGQSVLRVEDARLVTGRGRFVGDVELPRMLHAAFVRSYLPHASIDRIALDAAVASPAVHNVLVAADLPEVYLSSGRHPALAVTPQPPLARDKVRFVGEPVALVLAEDRYRAEDAVDLVDISYTQLGRGEPLFSDIPGNVVFVDSASLGEVDRAFAEADVVVSQSLAMARQNASPLEPRGCVADFDPASRQLTIYSCTQGPHRLRRDLATVTGLTEGQIRVVIMDIGGAFGQKIPTQLEDVAVVLAAMAVGRPVKWIEDRRENLIAAPHSRGQSLSVELAVDDELRISGLRGTFTGDAGAYSFNSASPLTEAYRSSRALPGVYDIGSYGYETTIEVTNRSPIAPYRGVGFVAAQVIRELAIDKAARTRGVDSREVRRRNIVTAERLPFTSLTGWRYADVSFVETFEAASRQLDRVIAELPPVADGWLRGVSVTPFVEPSGIGSRGGAEVHGFSSASHDSARVSLDPHGSVLVSFGTPSIGQGLETTMAQVAAQALGLPLASVSVAWGDTSQAPISFTGARASRSAVVSGGAVRLASLELRSQLADIAAEVLSVDAYDVHFEDGEVWIAGDTTPRMTMGDLAAAAFTTDRSDAKLQHALDVTRSFDPPASYSNAAVAAVLDVDRSTGSVTIQSLLAVEDCGQVINPLVVDGQFLGGAVQAIGAVLFEGFRYSEDDQPLTATLMDYLLPTAADALNIEVHHHQPVTVWNEDAGGVKGVGESGVIGTVGAIACALADALSQAGGEVTRLPMLPFQIWEELHHSAPARPMESDDEA